ncbi:MAG: hypothetical protein AAF433_09215 [Bacteroidota bacterium]
MRFWGLLLFLLCTSTLVAQTPAGPMVWSQAEGGQRGEYVYFRRSFRLADLPQTAELQLYADSRYALYVNGQYLGFGPVRSYHAHPYFDSYDLRPYLREGDNVIAVQALSNGMVTYQLFDYHGGFAAWGTIETSQQKIDLSTAADWLCRPSKGYDTTAPRFSFATGPMEIWDSRGEADWAAIETTTQGWQATVALTDQERWGDFEPRPIPALTQEEHQPLRQMGAYPLSQMEDLYSFRIPTSDEDLRKYNQSQTALAYTYLYSPVAQEVEMGLWWGNYFLNGESIQPLPGQEDARYRRQYRVQLQAGWNSFVVRYGIIWGSWDFYLGLPKGLGLEVAADQTIGEGPIFYSYGPFGVEANEALLGLNLGQSPEQLRSITDQDWQPQSRDQDAYQPARAMVWQPPLANEPLELEMTTDGSWLLPVEEAGIALTYALEETQLGQIFVEGDFPEGTQIDIGFSEELEPLSGLPWLYKRFQIGAGMRFITSEGRDYYSSFKPFGVKYLQINFSNYDRPIQLRRLGVRRQLYPLATKGSFSCSDPLLTRIWEAGWRTLQLCAEDSYTDTPFRERGLYAGDMLPQLAITMAVNGDLRLGEHSLRIFQDMYREEMLNGRENRHNDYPVLTQLALDYLCQYTGEWSLVEETYANYASLLRHHWSKRNEQGLIPASRVFLEWTDINKSEAAMTAYQALLVESMTIQAAWAKRLEKEEDQRFFLRAADQLQRSVESVLRDPAAPNYFDGWQADSLIADKHLTSTIWPLLFGLHDPATEQATIEWLGEELSDIGTQSRARKITPYSSFYLFALLYRNDEAALAESFMREHWGPMALHSDRPTVWENFDIEGGQGTSSHAWSGHPTYFLATEVLGVNLGFYQPWQRELIEISPQSASLSWAAGEVMHPLGKVELRWEVRGEQLWLWYSAPEGAEVVVKPRGRLGELELVLNPG